MVVGLGALALVVSGCGAALPAGTRQGAGGGSAVAAGRPAIPAIDARVPGTVETATFALG